MIILYLVAAAVIAAAIGVSVTLIVQRKMAATRAKQILADAEREAEDLKRNRVLEGREEALKITTEAEKQASQKIAKAQSIEAKQDRKSVV